MINCIIIFIYIVEMEMKVLKPYKINVAH